MRSFIPYFLIFGCLFCEKTFSQDPKFSIDGEWKIYRTVGLFTSDVEDKIFVYKQCTLKKVVIKGTLFQIKPSNKCPIRSRKDFKYQYMQELTKTNASDDYSDIFVHTIFDEKKLNKVYLYSTNYVLENADIDNLEIIFRNSNDIVLYDGLYLYFLKRVLSIR